VIESSQLELTQELENPELEESVAINPALEVYPNAVDIKDYMVENNGIIIANPNAPTSVALSKEEIEQIVKKNKERVVIIDEAYVDFGGESVISLIKEYNNLLVIKTLSKSYALAGLRVGFAIGDKELINGMNKIKNSFNSYPIDMIAQIRSKRGNKGYTIFK